MQTPAAMFIESALDSLDPSAVSTDGTLEQDEAREFVDAIGEDKAKKFGLTYPLTPDAKQAYVIALATARIMLLMNPTLTRAGVKANDLL